MRLNLLPYLCINGMPTRVLAVLAALSLLTLTAMASGCSEPQVVEKIVEVEKVVVVTATPVPTPAAEQDTGDEPTLVDDWSVLIVDAESLGYSSYSNFAALGFSKGIPTGVVNPPRSGERYVHTIPKSLSIREHPGIIVVGKPEGDLLEQMHEYALSGGNLAILVNSCYGNVRPDLERIFGISCGETNFGMRGRGEQFAPFLRGLVINVQHLDDDFLRHAEYRTNFLSGPSGDFRCVAKAKTLINEQMVELCTALYGTVGHGKVIVMAGGWIVTSSGIMGATYVSPEWFNDEFIHGMDHERAALRLFNWLVDKPIQDASTNNSFDTASVLARFSASDPVEGEERASAAGEIIEQHRSGNVDSARIADLLHTVAPELSIDDRITAAEELARISADDQWDETETAEGVLYLATLITGEEPNPQERIEAAREMVELYENGSLDADRGLTLMNTIAPGLSINERRKAAAALAKLSADDNGDNYDRMTAANEVFRLATGVPLDAEARMRAAVDLAGVGVKIFDTRDSFDDRDIDNATEIIKQSLTGDLTSESLQVILELGK